MSTSSRTFSSAVVSFLEIMQISYQTLVTSTTFLVIAYCRSNLCVGFPASNWLAKMVIWILIGLAGFLIVTPFFVHATGTFSYLGPWLFLFGIVQLHVMQGFGAFIGLHLLNARFKNNIQRSRVTRISNPKIVKKRFRFPDGVVVPLYACLILVNLN